VEADSKKSPKGLRSWILNSIRWLVAAELRRCGDDRIIAKLALSRGRITVVRGLPWLITSPLHEVNGT
jgi:hypothetical protein